MTPFSIAQKGYYIFPVDHELRWNPKRKKYERTPLVRWRTECTLDPTKIGEWLGRWPNCWWGIDCGASGLFVIDDDRGKNVSAVESLDKLEAVHGPLPETFTVKTKSGGYHYYYRGEGRNSASGAFGPGVDTRATGGYVVAPCVPGYMAQDPEAEVADAPTWMLTLAGKPRTRDPRRDEGPGIELDTPDAIDQAKSYLEHAPVAVDGEGGGFRTIAVACRVRDYGVSEAACLDLIYNSGWNKRCLPPWTDLDELATKIRNAYLCAHDPIGSANPRRIFPKYDAPGALHAEDLTRHDRFPAGGNPRGGRASLFADAASLLIGPMTVDYLVRGMIETPSTGQLYGDPSAGKTFLALDLACNVAAGAEWMGGLVRSGLVVYFAGEGAPGLRRRIAAWCKDRGLKFPAGVMAVSQRRIEFSPSPLAEAATELQALEKSSNRKVVLVIVDTLARHMPAGADENSAKDAGSFILGCDWIRDQFDCVVAVVHHCGKMAKDSSRGSSALRGAWDWEARVKNEKGHRTLTWTKQKEGELPMAREFTLESVTIGDGVQSAVVRMGGAVGQDPEEGLKPDAKDALAVLRMSFSEAGVGEGGDLDLLVWKMAYLATLPAEMSRSAKSMKFIRAERSLVEAGMVRVNGGKVSLV